MKIVVYIPTMTEGKYFDRVVKNFLNYEHDVNIRSYHDPSLGYALTHQYRKHLIEDCGKFDVYIYCEDDILITEKVFNTWIEENRKLIDAWTIGVVRYEEFLGAKYLPEFNVTYGHNHKLEPMVKIINGRRYFYTENPHQGCWILEQRNLNAILKGDRFVFDWGTGLEDAASNVYLSKKWPGTQNGLWKVIPEDRVDDLLVHHLSNKFVNHFDEIWSLNKLKDYLCKAAGN